MQCGECGAYVGAPGRDAYVWLTPDGDERLLCAECHDAYLWLSEPEEAAEQS